MDDMFFVSNISRKRDRLSELPHSLILHILSFLPMKSVVSTTRLSKRWKNLWTTVPCLNFIGDITSEEKAEKFRNFVNRALIFRGGNKILKFKIDLDGHFNKSLAKDIDLWVRFAVENQVEELNVRLMYDEAVMEWVYDAVKNGKIDVYGAPQCLYSCSSLKSLSLVGCNLRIPQPPPWNELKSLRIDGFCFTERLINLVLSSAPQLEVFRLRLLESFENLNIRSRSLRNLKIKKFLHFDKEDHPSTDKVLRIWCPKLETLELSGILYSMYLLTNVSSLTDATLGFKGSYYYDNDGLSGNELLGEALRQIFSCIPQVEKVALSDWCVQVLGVGATEKKYLMSPFSTVEFLKLNVAIIELDKMVHILGISHKLKRLVIEHKGRRRTVNYDEEYDGYDSDYIEDEYVAENYLECERNLSKSFLLLLRTVEITSPLSKISSIFAFIEFLLKHATMLEKMVIRNKGIMSRPTESLFAATEELLSMPRSSPTAKVIFLRK